MKKSTGKFFAVLTAIAVMFTGCLSTDVEDGVDPNISGGINAWNRRGPESAEAWWSDIEDAKEKEKWLGYITAYNQAVEALNSTDGYSDKQESKKLSACNTAISKFGSLDKNLNIEEEYIEKGADLAAGRISKLIDQEKFSEAKNLYAKATKVYGKHDNLEYENRKHVIINSVIAKKDLIKSEEDAVEEIEDVDEKIKAYDELLAKYTIVEKELNAEVSKSGYGNIAVVKNQVTSFKKIGQDVTVRRQRAIREKAYEYKERIGEVFARQLEGTGSGKNGAFTNQEILNHYNGVKNDMQVVYNELLAFQKVYPNEIDNAVISDINSQKKTLESKIAVVEREIAKEKEIASRGKYIGMLGLFNPDTTDPKKSKPVKFSGSNPKDSAYLWGIVDIPAGTMNDLVITMKDNRTVRVYNQNTKSGKQISKLGLEDLVSKANKVGNSWPVMNAGKALNGSIFYLVIDPGKTPEFAGEVVVYSSFITRSR